jgi:hypothetical protein
VDVRVANDGPVVIIQITDQGRSVVLQLEPKAAREMVDAVHQKILAAEEILHAEQIAFDSAILIRAGAPFTLTDNPKIQDMAATEAAHNRTLRRSALQGIKSTAIVGTPSLIPTPPKGH